MIEDLILQCAVATASPAIVQEIIQVESAAVVTAINVNGDDMVQLPASDAIEDLSSFIRVQIAEGRTVDVGLMQVNTRHLSDFGLDVEDLFDPCVNIATGSAIFMRGYDAAKAFYGDTPLALQSALSAYNTGTFHRGFGNGYIDRYEGDRPNAELPQRIDPGKAAAESDIQIELDFTRTHLSDSVSPDTDAKPDPDPR